MTSLHQARDVNKTRPRINRKQPHSRVLNRISVVHLVEITTMSVQRSRRASRPTTPLRRSVSRPGHTLASTELPSSFPLDALKPQLSELSDSLADLDTNFQYLDIMHENLARFSESFAAFLYGLEVNAWHRPQAHSKDSTSTSF
ncbi:DASH complex subunit Dam1-domain-containing protein [Lipomyces doorenjongii]